MIIIIIIWELRMKFKFSLTNKWYMHNPEFILENFAQKILWDFEIQTDHLIPVRRPRMEIVHRKREPAE